MENAGRTRHLTFRFLLLLGVLAATAACQGGDGPRTGGKALDFALKDLEGRTHQLSDYRGKMVHLHFWADWCPRCHEEFDNMGGAYRRLKTIYPDFEILGVNVDQPLVHVEEFLKMHVIDFPILLDTGSQVARSYGIKGIPCNFLIGRDGKIEDVLLGWVDEEYLENSLRNLSGRGG